MKTIVTIIALFQIVTASGQQYLLHPEQSKIQWIGYGEIGGFKQEGSIEAKTGSLTLENGNIIAATVEIDMTTINHPDKTLSQHLTKKDFFWIKKYTSAKMTINSIVNNQVNAELTIRGITQPIEFPVEIEKNETSITINGTMTIDRTIYDIKYNSSSYFQDLGNYAIKNEFDLKFEITFKKE